MGHVCFIRRHLATALGVIPADDIPFNRFKRLPPDPNKFDSDQDGIGCER